MSTAAVVAIVLVLFFLVGAAVGFLVVVAVSARRAHKAVPQVRPVVPRPGAWPHLPGPGSDESDPDDVPWWRAQGGN